MSESVTISAKNLGGVAIPDSARAVSGLDARGKIPFQIFPGIFSSIDSNAKKPGAWLVRSAPGSAAVARRRSATSRVTAILRTTANSAFSTGKPTSFCVGRPTESGMDAIPHLIVDYKTAKFTAHQDELFPMYEVQLNAYALIGEQKGLAPVSGLALVYTEPVTDDATAAKDGNQTNTGFLMEFSAHIRQVDLSPENIPPLLARVREVYDRKRPPNPRKGCNDCARLQDLIRLAGG